jgi:hypothetical protein
MVADKVQLKVAYNGKDISEDISKYCIGVTYKDNTEGMSDTIELRLEDVDQYWKNGWYPEKGAVLTVAIGENGVFLDCGVFEIDQIQASGPPDTVTLQGLGTGISGDIRTKVSTAHANKTLPQIASTIAKKNGLTLEGTLLPIVIERVTQNNETDLAFLNRISKEYGFIFSVRGKKLTFMSIYDIEDLPSKLEIDKTDCTSYDLLDKTLKTYSKVEVKYHNPKTKTVSTYVETVKNKDGVPFTYIRTKDVLTIHTKAENEQQAKAKAQAAIYRANSLQQEGSISTKGNPYLCAGNNFDLIGLGLFSGKYHIMSSSHNVDRSGAWTTGVEIKKVGFVVKEKQKTTKERKPPKYTVSVVE